MLQLLLLLQFFKVLKANWSIYNVCVVNIWSLLHRLNGTTHAQQVATPNRDARVSQDKTKEPPATKKIVRKIWKYIYGLGTTNVEKGSN